MIASDGKKVLLYVDEVTYEIKNKKQEARLLTTLAKEARELLDEKIKLEIYDKDEIRERTQKTRFD